jgi:DnaJ-class molecular chaperone
MAKDDRAPNADGESEVGLDDPSQHRRRCPECRGQKMLPGMVRTEGKGMGSRYGPCPTCDGLGYVTDETD